MAKKEKMVTRTFTTTSFTVIGIREGAIVKEASEAVVGKMSETEALDYARKFLATDGLMVAGIENIKHNTLLIGVPESEFFKIGVVLPPRTKEESEAEND